MLLCAGRLGVVENRRPQVTAFVRSILDSPDPTEEKLHRNLLLALAVAGDDVNLDPGLMSELVRRAVACMPTDVYAFARSLVEAPRAVGGQRRDGDACRPGGHLGE